jgi:hypothetical protein
MLLAVYLERVLSVDISHPVVSPVHLRWSRVLLEVSTMDLLP